MINVLFFAFEFAPNNTTGAHRSIKFVKNLKRFGINPIVVTAVAEDSFKFFGGPIDNHLMEGLQDTEIVRFPIKPPFGIFHRFKLFYFFKLFFRIDEGLSSRWPVDIEHLMRTYRPEAVVITLPPFSMWRIVVNIKEKYSIPVITDMRDAWALWAPGGYFSKLHYRITLSKERKLFSVSDRVLGVTPQLLKLFMMSHPEMPFEKFSVVHNSFDFSSFQLPCEAKLDFRENKKIRIGYVGAFYYMPRTNGKVTDIFRYYPLKDDWLYRSPYFFLKTLCSMFERSPELKLRIFFEFAGRIPAWLPKMIDSFGLSDNVVLHGFLSSKYLQKFQENCDLFLATAEKIDGMEHFCLPSKLFEYIKMGKPILGFVTEGIQKEFLDQSGIAFTFDPDLFEENVRRLSEIFNGITTKSMEVRKEYLLAFSDHDQTRSLANIVRTSVKKSELN